MSASERDAGVGAECLIALVDGDEDEGRFAERMAGAVIVLELLGELRNIRKGLSSYRK